MHLFLTNAILRVRRARWIHHRRQRVDPTAAAPGSTGTADLKRIDIKDVEGCVEVVRGDAVIVVLAEDVVQGEFDGVHLEN